MKHHRSVLYALLIVDRHVPRKALLLQCGHLDSCAITVIGCHRVYSWLYIILVSVSVIVKFLAGDHPPPGFGFWRFVLGGVSLGVCLSRLARALLACWVWALLGLLLFGVSCLGLISSQSLAVVGGRW